MRYQRFKVLAFRLIIMSQLLLDLTLFCADASNVCSTNSISSTGIVANVAVGADDVLRYSLRSRADE